MIEKLVRGILMLVSIPFVVVAVAFGWRPSKDKANKRAVEPTGLNPSESLHVAVMKFSAWLKAPEMPLPAQVQRLAEQLLHVDLEDIADGPLDAILHLADGCEPELLPMRRRAFGLALVAWSRALPQGEGTHARELGQACLAVGLATDVPSPSPRALPATEQEVGRS